MASAEVKKVLQLKLKLKESTEGHTLLKTLKKLHELDITLDVLAETGIGKVVNSFRKHDHVGEMAKTLVHQWKKLVPKDQSSIGETLHSNLEEPSKPSVQKIDQRNNSPISQSEVSSECKGKNEYSKSKYTDGKTKVKLNAVKLKPDMNNGKKENRNDMSLMLQSTKTIFQSEGCQEQLEKTKRIEKADTKKHDGSRTSLSSKEDGGKNAHKKGKRRTEKVTATVKDLGTEEFETPSMSFEEYLSYDLEPSKRKNRSRDKTSKRFRNNYTEHVDVPINIKYSNPVMEASTELASKGCVMDLLNVPLPAISPECDDLSQYQYFPEKKCFITEDKTAEVFDEALVFTGQRLNKKMQVYSGNKVIYLPSMLSLYQQCIRTLQNNIDSLYEIGGVPFEILEPVLERCTPEQLLRIEECNPVYIGLTDHLWERHCLRDFRNAQLMEYESWKEMYLRVFEEREHKLQKLTKSIISAHSGKPKGRQVKMAFIHSAAKPPRNVRIQQELHGTAAPGLPHTTDKPSGKNNENKGRLCSSDLSKPLTTCSGSGTPQDPRKIRRVAPMMAKSLKAFKKQFGRR